MKIIVSHPGKQHAYKLLKALEELGMEVTFCTSIAFQSGNNYFIRKYLNKRIIGNNKIYIKKFPLLEIGRLIGRKIANSISVQYYFERAFDWFCSRWLKKQEFDLFIGYECSSALCFQVCKEMGKTSILDLAQIHYKELGILGETYKCLNYLLDNDFQFKINKTKDLELNLSSKILSISNFVKDSLIKNNIPEEKIFDLFIGNEFTTTIIKERQSDKFNIIYVGSIRDQKGVSLLINCIDSIANPKINLTLIGQINEGHYTSLIKERDYISHISYVPNQMLNEYYQRSDIFVLPSYLDSWGMVVIEAMSNGIPTIVTENCGSKDAVTKGGGIIVKPDSLVELSQAIKFYLENETLRKRDGNIAKSIAVQYDQTQYKSQIKTILNTISVLN